MVDDGRYNKLTIGRFGSQYPMGTPSNFNLKDLEKPSERDADGSSSISGLPDELILEILNKIIDLKTLCSCYLVSRRLSTIVLQVHAISFTAPLINPHINTIGDVSASGSGLLTIPSHYSESFRSVNVFLSKFKGVKSLCIEFPSFREIGSDGPCLFKWMVKFGHRVESFMFLSPNSIFDMDGFCIKGNGDEDHNEVISRTFKQNFYISFQYLKEVIVWHMALLYFVKNHPMLEKVSITDSGGRGRLSLSGKKLSELKEWVHSAAETEFDRVKVPYVMSNSYFTILKLPVSGYVMKGVYFGVMKMKDLEGGNGDLMNKDDGFEDKEEVLYNEAVMEILEKHKGRMLAVVDDVLL